MDTEYDRKFEEMKKYIPFLENMIKRLESTGSPSGNPRQAQLAKIRSLRDLLLDKKKRMKMENLLKCEQVLVNLYAKVEQRDSFSETKNDMDMSQKTQLNFVRNKLKNVAAQLHNPETLPEIARASETEEMCTAGSKEPALFQRRPNKTSLSPTRLNICRESTSPSSRRNYTRILVSPERDLSKWPQEMSSEKTLFSRRSPRWTPRKSPKKSPRKSPRKYSPTHQKERKKSSKQSHKANRLKDLNITLKVPEESLHSLNTKDILSRIINCSDSDVDIETLRELRTQILSELKHTGAKDDISDLILKSYKNKKAPHEEKEEIEEGELSDSESEIIESIYGSLVIVDKDPGSLSGVKKSGDEDQQPRKIQICLVLNSEKEKQTESDLAQKVSGQSTVIDEADFESFNESKDVQKVEQEVEAKKDQQIQDKILSKGEACTTDKENNEKSLKIIENPNTESELSVDLTQNLDNSISKQDGSTNISCSSPNNVTSSNIMTSPIYTNSSPGDTTSNTAHVLSTKQVEIPLLDLESTAKQEVVNEIDILQALKKEILSEKMSLDDSETVTPPLHQPKVTKVSNIQGITLKKRISIEKYKQKSISASVQSLFTNESNSSASKDELLRKQSLKLTEKEYERFNLPTKLALDESSDDEEKGKISPNVDDIYCNLAPKSPDHEDFADTGIKPPVIIPADPIKSMVATKADIDMRTLGPAISPHVTALKSGSNISSPCIYFEKTLDVVKNETELCSDKRMPLADPRVKRECNLPSTDSAILGTMDRNSRSHINFLPNKTPTRMPNVNMTLNINSAFTKNHNVISNNTPNVATNINVFEVNTSRQSFENDEYSKQNHVYAPLFQVIDPNDSVSNDGQHSRTNTVINNIDFQNPSMFNRLDCPQTPIHTFGMSECSPSPAHAFGRMEVPMPSISTFGRTETPMTPVHTFGRNDCPTTPSHSFGRVDCPSTPSHTFGRVDCPSTPSHPFGKADVHMTPSHSFGRADFPQNQLPSQKPPPRYNKFQDPRINRHSDYDSMVKYDDDRDRGNYKECNSNYNKRNYKFDQPKREPKYRDPATRRKEKYESMRHFSSRTYEVDRYYSNSRSKGYGDRDYRYESDSKITKDTSLRRNSERERSIEQSVPEDRYGWRNNEREVKSENTLSVESHAGRAFIIDTSVNRSFQEQLETLKGASECDSNFDLRRKRASSVGRCLAPEPSVERNLSRTTNKPSVEIVKNTNFRRACSVDRETANYDTMKSFKDIKEDLQAYKRINDIKHSQSDNKFCNKNTITVENTKINHRDPRLSRRDSNDLQHIKHKGPSPKPYSQNISNQDPRFNREFYREPHKKYQEQIRGKSYETKKHGIVYSSANIARGTILGSGYGVRNYKIPKIKRAPEQTDNKETFDKFATITGKIKDNCPDKNTKLHFIKQDQDNVDAERSTNKLDNKIETAEKSKTKENKVSRWESPDKVNNLKLKNENIATSENEDNNIERRITRSSRKNIVNDSIVLNSECSTKKAYKLRRNVFYDSDSDNTENVISTNKELQNEMIPSSIEKKTKGMEHINDNKDNDTSNNKKLSCNSNSEQLQLETEKKINDYNIVKNKETEDLKPAESPVSETINGFGMDCEMFSDNVVTDPVIENINALIADLDEDLETSKNDGLKKQFVKEISTENMLGNKICVEITANENNDKRLVGKTLETDVENSSESLKKSTQDTDSTKNCSFEGTTNVNNEYTSEVSTTENEKFIVHTDQLQSKLNNNQGESCFIPDSTIEMNGNTQNKNLEGMPDSTIELACELSSDITSTHDSNDAFSKVNVEMTTSRLESSSQSDSIGSLLSILKDKSKIKELLTLLKDQSSENDKLKKKLEKLSEIVSDDEDSTSVETVTPDSVKNDGNDQEDTGNSKLKTKELVPIISDVTSRETIDNEKVVESFCSNKDEEDVNILENQQEQNIKAAHMIENEDNLEITVQSTEKSNAFKNKNEKTCLQNIEHNNEHTDSTKKSAKNTKTTKKGKCKGKNNTLDKKKRLTRSDSVNFKIDKPSCIKKTSRELKQLQDDIKEMFLHDDVFNATGIRMCRLAKLVEDKSSIDKVESQNAEGGPVVILEKIKQSSEGKIANKKVTTKSKGPQKEIPIVTDKQVLNNGNTIGDLKIPLKSRPGPKSKTKLPAKQADVDPYVFETDSISERNNTTNVTEYNAQSSESESESLESSRSFSSTEHLEELKKKPKRKRRVWQAGVIKPKHKKKKVETNNFENETVIDNLRQSSFSIPDLNCFIDKTYCFTKSVSIYPCRLCLYTGKNIVDHYKKQHPHSEIPLSRMSPAVAKEAIEQCEEINFQAVSKISTDKYVCRFCYKEFSRKKTVLEAFFWHVVSMHTGEYKQLCSECINVTKCPFNLDIPPPPKEPKGQLIGYICGKCNFTQISLENLKTHVINRHNDEQTEVYTINLAVMSKKTLALAVTKSLPKQPRMLRSSRLNRNIIETNNGQSDSDNDNKFDKVEPKLKKEMPPSPSKQVQKTSKRDKMQLKITFENEEEAVNKICNLDETVNVKIEQEQQIDDQYTSHFNESKVVPPVTDVDAPITNTEENPNKTIVTMDSKQTSDDIFDYPHFKINYTKAGTKEYVCCINGIENHYRTALLISLKKHVQIKHSEKWDGFCFLCKLIVTPQGNHRFKDCLQHFLDKHIDSFPLLESREIKKNDNESTDAIPFKEKFTDDKSNKSYLNVRPLSELISQSETRPTLPVIESVMSLGTTTDNATHISVNINDKKNLDKEYKYEEAQAEIIAKKNNVVLEIMMKREKIVHIFKCAGSFCSFSTDHAEDALRHAVTHERVGGENSLKCAYCDFDSSSNAVDLVTHVFKVHGVCPFVCAHCFYRGAASQLVCAHAIRIHGKATGQSVVLRSTTTSRSDTVDAILPREIAVPFYVCHQNMNEAGCKFKTYTSGKFCEHLQTRHQSDTTFSCFVCSGIFAKPVDLLQHLKTHGFKLYQCTWCVHGADNETELLAHASEKHPNKPPQAYLRVITNKEGTTGFRVLPLAHLNNSKIPTEDVTPNSTRGNPEREAERSIDLENLIGQTTQMIESMATTVQSESSEVCEEKETVSMPIFRPEPLIQSQEALVSALQSSLLEQTQKASESSEVSQEQSSGLPPRAVTPELIGDPVEINVHTQLTPVIKREPEQSTPEKTNSDIIYCLDSDDDTASNENVIDLSSEEPLPDVNKINKSENLKLVPRSELFKCSLCGLIFKNSSGFKRHVSALHPQEMNVLSCAHCSYVASRDILVNHYTADHCMVDQYIRPRYMCALCNNNYVTFAFVKKHLKEDHFLTKMAVTSKLVTNGGYQFVVGEAVKQKQVTKRKLSNESDDRNSQPVLKMKKFGPKDISRLPINPILDELVYCSLCEFSTKVRLNMVRHLQLHAEQQPVPQTAPVNPVPHLETNEKHFDKMVNLASSSISSRASEKSNKADQEPVVNLVIPPEAASQYPKYVPDRQRYTCGAKGCCYISVDETMLKYHWETLHSGSNDYHCVHCPPYQHLDTSKPLSSARIIAHLKMHDIRLYACSLCSYYHNKRQVLDKHISDVHRAGRVMVVREEGVSPASNLTQLSTATPTMDLKPWQCGLCKFKSMLRPEVVEHCAKVHQSKMQYKCAYCAFRTSTLENITKHQLKSHVGKPGETFYFYYREGSISDEPDGTPRWQKQRQKSGVTETRVKTEVVESTELESQNEPTKEDPLSLAVPVDLNIVKQDPDAVTTKVTVEDLCKAFGQFCNPNGLKYKCPLCENTSEDSREAMQSHLYEELQYRKWGCGICTYKAIHKNTLNDHMLTEHRQSREPIELPVDIRVETWITKLLYHQFLLIEKNRRNLAEQSIAMKSTKPTASTSTSQVARTETSDVTKEQNMEDLEKLFGKFGVPDNMKFNCPKCNFKVKEESVMRDHLEIELNKIRWCCDCCSDKFQNYHEAQFHCKSVHTGLSARAVEAVRDVGMRSAWIAAVLRVQKLSMNYLPVTETTDAVAVPENNIASDNSLLVVRYEERVPTPEVQVARSRTSVIDSDDDENKLVIDEPSNETVGKKCPFCLYSYKDLKDLKEHNILKHADIKPYFCSYCDFNGYRKTVLNHLNQKHNDKPVLLLTKAQRSLGRPLGTNPVVATVEEDTSRLICLKCEKSFTENEAKSHMHGKMKSTFAKKGQIVVKCCLCLTLHENIDAATAHHMSCHPNDTLNYAYFKLNYNKRSIYCCGYCEQHFHFWRDLKVHCQAVHSSLPFVFNKRQFAGAPSDSVISLDDDDDEVGVKRNSESASGGPAPKMCARKSTTKLPVQAVAKKSTTKLPFSNGSELGEYSFYGSKPQLEDFENVTTNMSFGNTVVPFTFKQLSEVIQIDPTVRIQDFNK